MPTPRGGYFTKDGKRVPSVTTIIGKFKDAGGLMHWAWDLGRQGKYYRDERDKAANSGTIAHLLVEQWIHKQDPTVEGTHPADVESRAWKAFEAFKQWAQQTKLSVTETEIGLVSEKHRFGGTLDAMLVNGKRSLGDWKTSNAVYGEYLYQLAAYGLLWEENFPDKPIQGGYHLLRFSKDYPDFCHHFFDELESAKRGFILMRELYDIKEVLDRRVK